jgi:hypothetical protein
MTDLHDEALRRAFDPLREETATHDEIRATIARRGAERRTRRRRAAAGVIPIAVAVSLIVAFAPIADDDGARPGLAFLPERAEAAIAPAERILELTIRVESTTGTDATEWITAREWSLAGAGQAMQTRRLITEGDLDQPPTDEDFTSFVDRDGRIVDGRAWMPIGDGSRGRIERLDVPAPPTLVEMLRDAYERELLRPAGTTADGALRLRGRLRDVKCQRAEVLLDPRTFIPRRIEVVDQLTARPSAPCRDDAPVHREVDRITGARTVPATTENRELLEIGDWPVVGSRLPPPPPLDED